MSAGSALRFIDAPIHPNQEGNLLLHFREQGFVVVPNVFERDSVDPYLEQIRALVRPGPGPWQPLMIPLDDEVVIAPARAPKLRHLLRSAFSWGRERPQACFARPDWLIRQANPDQKQVHDWHKDGDHEGFGTLKGYQHPSWIHAVMYFTDMTPAHGPTYVIPRSHRDPDLSPHAGAVEAPFLPGKGDVVLWDQRTWHRGSARTVEGLRIVAIFPFFPVPTLGDQPLVPCKAQRQALAEATTAEERFLFGGPFDLS